ncbi:MAG: Regulatory protein VanR, partial [Clostridium butyricum DORA_1]
FGFDGESDILAIVEHIKNIRNKFKKIGINPIETVWGIGYRWKE